MIAGLWLCAIIAHGQDYSADSIHYTPIPREQVSGKKPPAQVFRDTVQNIKLIEYFFNVNAGTLVGCHDCQVAKEPAFTASTIHGVIIGRKLRTGFGLGIDGYDSWTTMPLFGNLSWDLLGTRNTHALFLQGQYGWAYAWQIAPEQYGLKDNKGGQMTAVHIGYRFRYHDVQFALLVGAKKQYVFSYYEYPTVYVGPNGELIEGTPSRMSVKQTMDRLIISLSVGWK